MANMVVRMPPKSNQILFVFRSLFFTAFDGDWDSDDSKLCDKSEDISCRSIRPSVPYR